MESNTGSENMYAVSTKDADDKDIQERRSAVEQKILDLKKAATGAATEDELDDIQGKIQQLVRKYKLSLREKLFEVGEMVIRMKGELFHGICTIAEVSDGGDIKIKLHDGSVVDADLGSLERTTKKTITMVNGSSREVYSTSGYQGHCSGEQLRLLKQGEGLRTEITDAEKLIFVGVDADGNAIIDADGGCFQFAPSTHPLKTYFYE